MNAQVCVICNNKKDVNSTSNRLVTESCGHVKCMECLLQEKFGCSACASLIEIEISPNKVEDKLLDAEKIQRTKPEISHIKIETDGKIKSYECTVCRKKFQSRSMVGYHAYCNGQKKPYQCQYGDCNKSFATLSYYKYHMRVHLNDRSFPCDICGDSFFQKSKLQRHMLKHSKDKKYICKQCSKGFTNSTALRRHELTHTEERPYCCNICGRRFRDSSNFRKHVIKHDKCAKPMEPGRVLLRAHACPRCAQAFGSRKDMRRHMQVHTDTKPFRCRVCSRRFRRKDNLDRHVRNTHSGAQAALAQTHVDLADSDHHQQNGHTSPEPKKMEEITDKKKLESLNPLPPLPKEVIQNHINTAPKETVIDKSYILEANNARQSVIVTGTDRRNPSPVPEYVHKIRKANSMHCQKDMPLPPIDATKIIELEKANLDVGVPLQKDIETYKNILYDKFERNGEDESKVQSVPEMHWRRKMKLGINW